MNSAMVVSRGSASARPARRPWDRYWLLIAPVAAVLVVVYLLPLAHVMWISLSEPAVGLQNYREVFASPAVLMILARTLRICLFTTLLAVLIGYLIAYALVHVGPRQRLAMMFGVLLPFWISVLIRAFAWVYALGDTGPVNSALMALGVIDEPIAMVRSEVGVVIGMVHYMVPYAVLPMFANLQGIDPVFVRAAKGLGASGWTTFLRVYLPMSLPGIAGAGILVFIFSLGFFVTPVILGGGRTVMVSEYINMEMLTLTNWGLATALAAILLISVLSILALVARFLDIRQLFGAK